MKMTYDELREIIDRAGKDAVTKYRLAQERKDYVVELQEKLALKDLLIAELKAVAYPKAESKEVDHL